MNKSRERPIYFVCAAIHNNELITKIITATSVEDASKLFQKEFSLLPKDILGPFYKKKTKILETTRVLKFANITKKAIYNEWSVNAFMLKDPENHAYLVFLTRTDDKKTTLPQGTIIVPISDLRFI